MFEVKSTRRGILETQWYGSTWWLMADARSDGVAAGAALFVKYCGYLSSLKWYGLIKHFSYHKFLYTPLKNCQVINRSNEIYLVLKLYPNKCRFCFFKFLMVPIFFHFLKCFRAISCSTT